MKIDRSLRATTLCVLLATAWSAMVAPGITAGAQPAETESGWRIEQLADGVYAALQSRENWVNQSNSVVIVRERDVVVVDAQSDADLVLPRRLR